MIAKPLSKLQLILLLSGVFFSFTQLQAQKFETIPFGMAHHSVSEGHNERCGHQILEEKLEKELGFLGSKDAFESWISQKIDKRRNQLMKHLAPCGHLSVDGAINDCVGNFVWKATFSNHL